MAIDTLGANALASNSVTTAKIAADAVTSAKIPADAVIASDIADGSITTAKLADNSVTSAKALNLGRRNLIINGALNIDQRLSFGTTTTADGSGYLGDRLNIEGLVGGGGATMQVVSDAPDVFPNGKSGKVTVTGTDTSLAGSDRYTLRHIIEGKNSARLGFGTSNAKTCTLSFYVKSSLTGTFCVAVGNGANDRGRPFEYTINSANTWERKTIEVAGDTSGTYLTDAGRGIILRWCMGVGSARQAAAGSYSAQEVHGTSNQTNLFATNSATFQITGLQFEEGSVATDFEHLSVGEELSLCQRYCEIIPAGHQMVGRIESSSNNWSKGQFTFKTTKRSGASMTVSHTDTSSPLMNVDWTSTNFTTAFSNLSKSQETTSGITFRLTDSSFNTNDSGAAHISPNSGNLIIEDEL